MKTDKPLLLLIEDSEDDAFFFNRTFSKSGVSCVVHHVMNGAEAIEFLSGAADRNRAALPSMILLDLKMPVLNGFDVLAWLQKQPFSSEIPVIVLTGSDQQKDKDRARQLGATDYLVKPIQVDDLRHFLREICPGAGCAETETEKNGATS